VASATSWSFSAASMSRLRVLAGDERGDGVGDLAAHLLLFSGV
jgi:hypothetical protein